MNKCGIVVAVVILLSCFLTTSLLAVEGVPTTTTNQGIIICSPWPSCLNSPTASVKVGHPITGDSVNITSDYYEGPFSFQPDSSGAYSIIIGNHVPLSADVFSDTGLYMQLLINGQPIAPAARLTTVPYAFVTQRVMGDVETSPGKLFVVGSGWEIGIGDGRILLQSGGDSLLNISDLDGFNWWGRANFGKGNTIIDTSVAFVAGENCHATGAWSTVGGGGDNTASQVYTTVAGGHNCGASASGASVLGGYQNIAGGTDAAVGGGYGNWAFGARSVIAGGQGNLVTGGASFAAGDQCKVAGNYSAAIGTLCKAANTISYAFGNRAEAHHDGAVVISANSSMVMTDTISSSGAEQMVLRADGGFYLGKNTNLASIPGTDFLYTSSGAHLTTGGVWTNSCDSSAKENFETVDGEALLSKLADLPISEWNYKAENPSIRHIGPTAQDFSRQFALGTDDKSISTIDPSGIALAAIKALDKRTLELREKTDELETQKQQIANLTKLVEELKLMVERLQSKGN